jgi:hypothetical protein
MKANKIYQTINFERGQDPKNAMEIGQVRDKKKLISMMSDPGKFPSSDTAKIKFDYMIKVIKDPSTKVVFERFDESRPGRIIITLPPSLINVFFFSSMEENLGRTYDIEAYPWDNPENNSMMIWINS